MKIKPLPFVITLLSVVCLAAAVAVTFNSEPQQQGSKSSAQGASTSDSQSATEKSARASQTQVSIPSLVVVHAQSGSYQALVWWQLNHMS